MCRVPTAPYALHRNDMKGTPTDPMQIKATLTLIALGLAFGSAFLFTKVVVHEISATELVAGRLLLGAVTVAAIMLVMQRAPRITPAALIGAAALALFDSIVPFTLIAWAETRIDSGVCSVIVSTMPLFTVLFAAATLPDERLAPGGILGLSAGFLGVVVLGGGDTTDITSSGTLGLLAVVGAAASYGIAAVIARRLLCDNDALELTGMKLAIAALIAFALTFAVEGAPDYAALSPKGGLALLALGVISTSAAFAVFLWVVRQVGSVKASLVTYIVPVVGLLLGWLVLGEHIGPATILGALLITAGISAVMHNPEQSPEATDAPLACPAPLFAPRRQPGPA